MSPNKSDSKPNQEQSCLVCGAVPASLKRGLCEKHYQQFRRKRDVLTEEASEAWEQQLVDAGKLLPKQQGKKFGSEDPFLESFENFVAENPASYKKTSLTTKELVSLAKMKQLENQPKPNPKVDND